MNLRLSVLLTAWALIFPGNHSAAQVKVDEDLSLPLQFVEGKLNQRAQRGFNGVMLIRHKGKTIYHKAFGFRDREAKQKMKVEHGFDIGSLVKPITAVAVLRLEQDGKLKTTDTLGHFFEGMPDEKKAITIRQLLRHEAGLPDIFGGDYQLLAKDAFLKKVHECKLICRPGTNESYSNAGYTLLACVIEKVSGQSYEKYVSEMVLKPAGTEAIGYVLPKWKKQELAVGYRDRVRWGTPLDKKWAADGPSWNLRGNGGMLATAMQMCQWYEALIAGKIINQKQLKKYYAFDAGKSKTTQGVAMGHAGGNGIFNTLQLTYVDIDYHMTFFSSNSEQQAEVVWRDFRSEITSMVREAAGIKKK